MIWHDAHCVFMSTAASGISTTTLVPRSQTGEFHTISLYNLLFAQRFLDAETHCDEWTDL